MGGYSGSTSVRPGRYSHTLRSFPFRVFSVILVFLYGLEELSARSLKLYDNIYLYNTYLDRS